MPTNYYGKMWIATQQQLKDVLLQEEVMQSMKPTQNRQRAHRIFASIFARYINLCNNLGLMYDQTLQAQKSVVLQNLLEAATNRMLELQNELKEIEFSEFIYMDNVLIEMKYTPFDIQFIVPYYYPMERDKKIQNIVDGVEAVSEEPLTFDDRMKSILGDNESARPQNANKKPLLQQEKMTMSEAEVQELHAVNVIKAHEKARQGRIFATNIRLHPDKYQIAESHSDTDIIRYEFSHKECQKMHFPVKRTVYSMDFYKDGYLRNKSLNNKFSRTEEKKVSKPIEQYILEHHAAYVIQRAYSSYKIKQEEEELNIKKALILGMIEGKKPNRDFDKQIREERKANSRRKEKFVRNLEKATQDEKARILKLKTPWIMEDVTDQIRYWFREMYDAGGQLDIFPPEAKGGTLLVIRGETSTPEEFPQVLKDREAAGKMTKEEKAKLKEEAKKLKAAEREKKKAEKAKEKLAKDLAAKQAEKEGKTWNFKGEEYVTKNYINLKETMEEYEAKWAFINEMKNINDDPYMEWITEEKYAEVHVELRKVVDEFMRLEYELLRMAWCQDNKKRYKEPKPKKEKKGKKGKKGKKAPKDITANKTVAQLYNEMVETGLILHKYPKVDLEDFIGDFNYGAYELRHVQGQDPPHFMGDVRNVLRGWIFGMSSITTKKPRSLCIAGPPLSGKKLLAFALASEMDAVIMNLSPDVVIKYDGQINYLVHLVTKMSRILQPTVLFIDGANKPFIKKCPAAERPLKPTLLGKVLFKKIVKAIKPVDRVMLIGTTNEPWNGAPGKMKKAYEKTLLVPAIDYGSAFLCWREGCLRHHAVNPMLDFSSLAMVSQKFTSGLILKAATDVLNIYRRMDLSQNPLKMEELLDGLLYGNEPPLCFQMTDKILAKYTKWFAKANKLQKQQVKNRAMLDAKNKPK